MVWAQAFPFVALYFVDDDTFNGRKSKMAVFLICSFGTWLFLLACTIYYTDPKYRSTFYGTKTGSSYTCELYQVGDSDLLKFDAAFTNRHSFTKPLHGKIHEWVIENIHRWIDEEKVSERANERTNERVN